MSAFSHPCLLQSCYMHGLPHLVVLQALVIALPGGPALLWRLVQRKVQQQGAALRPVVHQEGQEGKGDYQNAGDLQGQSAGWSSVLTPVQVPQCMATGTQESSDAAAAANDKVEL